MSAHLQMQSLELLEDQALPPEQPLVLRGVQAFVDSSIPNPVKTQLAAAHEALVASERERLMLASRLQTTAFERARVETTLRDTVEELQVTKQLVQELKYDPFSTLAVNATLQRKIGEMRAAADAVEAENQRLRAALDKTISEKIAAETSDRARAGQIGLLEAERTKLAESLLATQRSSATTAARVATMESEARVSRRHIHALENKLASAARRLSREDVRTSRQARVPSHCDACGFSMEEIAAERVQADTRIAELTSEIARLGDAAQLLSMHNSNTLRQARLSGLKAERDAHIATARAKADLETANKNLVAFKENALNEVSTYMSLNEEHQRRLTAQNEYLRDLTQMRLRESSEAGRHIRLQFSEFSGLLRDILGLVWMLGTSLEEQRLQRVRIQQARQDDAKQNAFLFKELQGRSARHDARWRAIQARILQQRSALGQNATPSTRDATLASYVSLLDDIVRMSESEAIETRATSDLASNARGLHIEGRLAEAEAHLSAVFAQESQRQEWLDLLSQHFPVLEERITRLSQDLQAYVRIHNNRAAAAAAESESRIVTSGGGLAVVPIAAAPVSVSVQTDDLAPTLQSLQQASQSLNVISATHSRAASASPAPSERPHEPIISMFGRIRQNIGFGVTGAVSQSYTLLNRVTEIVAPMPPQLDPLHPSHRDSLMAIRSVFANAANLIAIVNQPSFANAAGNSDHDQISADSTELPTSVSFGVQHGSSMTELPTSVSFGVQHGSSMTDPPTSVSFGVQHGSSMTELPTSVSFGVQHGSSMVVSFGVQHGSSMVVDDLNQSPLMQQQFSQLQMELEASRIATTSLRSQVESITAAFNYAKSNFAERIDALMAESVRLQEEKAMAKESLGVLMQQFASMDTDRIAAVSQQRILESELQTVREERSTLTARIAEIEEQLAAAQDHIESLSTEFASKEDQAAKRIADLIDQTVLLRQLEALTDTGRTASSADSLQVESLARDVARIRQQLVDTTAAYQSSEAAQQSLQTQIADTKQLYEKRLQEANDTVSQLRVSIDGYELELASLRSELLDKTHALEFLESKLDTTFLNSELSAQPPLSPTAATHDIQSIMDARVFKVQQQALELHALKERENADLRQSLASQQQQQLAGLMTLVHDLNRAMDQNKVLHLSLEFANKRLTDTKERLAAENMALREESARMRMLLMDSAAADSLSQLLIAGRDPSARMLTTGIAADDSSSLPDLETQRLLQAFKGRVLRDQHGLSAWLETLGQTTAQSTGSGRQLSMMARQVQAYCEILADLLDLVAALPARSTPAVDLSQWIASRPVLAKLASFVDTGSTSGHDTDAAVRDNDQDTTFESVAKLMFEFTRETRVFERTASQVRTIVQQMTTTTTFTSQTASHVPQPQTQPAARVLPSEAEASMSQMEGSWKSLVDQQAYLKQVVQHLMKSLVKSRAEIRAKDTMLRSADARLAQQHQPRLHSVSTQTQAEAATTPPSNAKAGKTVPLSRFLQLQSKLDQVTAAQSSASESMANDSERLLSKIMALQNELASMVDQRDALKHRLAQVQEQLAHANEAAVQTHAKHEAELEAAKTDTAAVEKFCMDDDDDLRHMETQRAALESLQKRTAQQLADIESARQVRVVLESQLQASEARISQLQTTTSRQAEELVALGQQRQAMELEFSRMASQLQTAQVAHAASSLSTGDRTPEEAPAPQQDRLSATSRAAQAASKRSRKRALADRGTQTRAIAMSDAQTQDNIQPEPEAPTCGLHQHQELSLQIVLVQTENASLKRLLASKHQSAADPSRDATSRLAELDAQLAEARQAKIRVESRLAELLSQHDREMAQLSGKHASAVADYQAAVGEVRRLKSQLDDQRRSQRLADQQTGDSVALSGVRAERDELERNVRQLMTETSELRRQMHQLDRERHDIRVRLIERDRAYGQVVLVLETHDQLLARITGFCDAVLRVSTNANMRKLRNAVVTMRDAIRQMQSAGGMTGGMGDLWKCLDADAWVPVADHVPLAVVATGSAGESTAPLADNAVARVTSPTTPAVPHADRLEHAVDSNDDAGSRPPARATAGAAPVPLERSISPVDAQHDQDPAEHQLEIMVAQREREFEQELRSIQLRSRIGAGGSEMSVADSSMAISAIERDLNAMRDDVRGHNSLPGTAAAAVLMESLVTTTTTTTTTTTRTTRGGSWPALVAEAETDRLADAVEQHYLRDMEHPDAASPGGSIGSPMSADTDPDMAHVRLMTKQSLASTAESIKAAMQARATLATSASESKAAAAEAAHRHNQQASHAQQDLEHIQLLTQRSLESTAETIREAVENNKTTAASWKRSSAVPPQSNLEHAQMLEMARIRALTQESVERTASLHGLLGALRRPSFDRNV
ncbi:hypothetical protein BC831DRAFT_551132 [Entophlyctis helioformis]|nr:hypothetical protein BC831DRAFT_551132 [Entophlyctis helioformis]